MKPWDQFCYMTASRSAALGSITWQEIFLSWRDLDAVIETGMPDRAVNVPTLGVGVASHLAEERTAFVALFSSDGKEQKWVLLWGSWANRLCPYRPPVIHFPLGKIGRGLLYRSYYEQSWKTASWGIRDRRGGFHVAGRRNRCKVSRTVAQWAGFILGLMFLMILLRERRE